MKKLFDRLDKYKSVLILITYLYLLILIIFFLFIENSNNSLKNNLIENKPDSYDCLIINSYGTIYYQGLQYTNIDYINISCEKLLEKFIYN